VITTCFACTKEKRSEVIINEVAKDDSLINVSNNNEEYKYIINTRTGKVHNYSDGINRVSEKYQLKSNENIETILENENYDICLNCRAGLKLNLDNYEKRVNKFAYDDEDDLSNSEVNLIMNYMRLYEFGQLDTEIQKFLICLFEVSNWYVNNVYTQLGGQKNIIEIENIAKTAASDSAYTKWRNYLDREYYSKYELKNNKRILSAVYDKGIPTDMAIYRCDLFKDAGYGKGDNIYSKSGMETLKNAEGEEIDKEWKNYCVIDDSSKFAAAVYYHYINKEVLKDEKQENRTAYDIDLWGTSSTMYLDLNSFTKKILKDKKFEIIPYDKIASNAQNISLSKFEPKTGDLLCREGHVEFFITKNKTISWGRVHKDFLITKEYKREKRGLVSSHPEDKNMPVTTIIRFTGGNSNEK
jgi:hypothetical protein